MKNWSTAFGMIVKFHVALGTSLQLLSCARLADVRPLG